MSEERVSVSVEVLNKVLANIAQQPYQQVAELISEVQKDAQSIEAEAAPELKAVDKAKNG